MSRRGRAAAVVAVRLRRVPCTWRGEGWCLLHLSCRHEAYRLALRILAAWP